MFEIGWIDFSKKDKDKAQQLLKFIKPEGQLDELGVGYVRDALSNQIFPGISTIQTRAKYFFIIPNILRDYLKLSPTEKRSNQAKKYLKNKEHDVKNKLRKKYSAQEGLGIIGVTLPERQEVKRSPSEIYWNGMQTYHFLEIGGLGMKQFLKNLSHSHTLEGIQTEEEKDDIEVVEELHSIKIPVDNHWFQNLDLNLTEVEQSFFHSQIIHSQFQKQDSLIVELAKNDQLREVFIDSSNFQEFVNASLELNYTQSVKDILMLSHDFAELMEGVHLLYNDILHYHIFGEDYDGVFLELWRKWRLGLDQLMINYSEFNPSTLFRYTKTSRNASELFISSWWNLIKKSNPYEEPTDEMRSLVAMREKKTKRKKSRLSKPASANTDVVLGRRIGLLKFQYRFLNAKIIIKDIYTIPPQKEEYAEAE